MREHHPSRRHELLAFLVPRLRRAAEIDDEAAERARVEAAHRTRDRSLPTLAVPGFARRWDVATADIGARQCNVTVTGYSSKQGTIASNALFAIERAQNSLRYLQQKGVKFIKASATGVGATDEFGPDFASNRRVVITVTP